VAQAGGSTNLCVVSAALQTDHFRLGRDIHRIQQNFVFAARTKLSIQLQLNNRVAGLNGLYAGVQSFMRLD